MRRLMKNILQESKPYDFLLLMVSAIVGFVLSLFGSTDITCICATVIVVLFILFWFLYNISENNADYMRMINREFSNEHWYDVFYLAFPICSTLRRMGKYGQAVKIAEMILKVLYKINEKKIDADWTGGDYTDIEKVKERLMMNDLGYTYFMLKNMTKAKQYVYSGIEIARENQIPYAELKGWSMLLQMMLIDNYDKYFTKDEADDIYRNFRESFDTYWGGLGDEFPSPELKDYIPCLKSLEIETMYKYQCLKIMDKQKYLEVMQKLADGYESKRLNDKYYDCMKRVLEIKLSDNAFDPHGNAETSLINIIDGAFEANIGLTPVQYIKYVTVYLEYYIRKKSVMDEERKREAKENRQRIRKYIKKIERELWYVEDPCVNRFDKIKKEYMRAVKNYRFQGIILNICYNLKIM